MHRIACALLLAAAALAACGGDESPVHFADLADGDYVGGPQKTLIEIDPEVLAARVELYLDGDRIATDDLAPFELIWDATAFPEAEHTLQARVYDADGKTVDGRVRIEIDNTAPTIRAVPGGATAGLPLVVDAFDNGEIASTVVVTASGELVSGTDPLSVLWAASTCGVETVEVRVTDRAGWTTTQTATVRSGRPNDFDCDGHLTVAAGGDDCDDLTPEAHAGAPDPGGGAIDLNCDGVPGVDADKDGVASESTGGEDCNDANASIHGERLAFARASIMSPSGQPLRWEPGATAIDSRSHNAPWRFAANVSGEIHVVEGSYGSDGAVSRIAARGANAGSIAIASAYGYPPVIAFGRGASLVVIDGRAPWQVLAELPTASVVGKVAIAIDESSGAARVAFQAGTSLIEASNSGGAWRQVTLVESGEPLVDAPTLDRGEAYFRTASGLWASGRSFDDTRTVRRIDDPNLAGERAALIADAYTFIYAINQGSTGRVFVGQQTLDLPAPVRRLAKTYNHLFVELDGAPVRAYRLRQSAPSPGIYTVLPGTSGLVGASYGVALTDAGAHVRSNAVFGASEIEDSVDQDCDGHAY